MNVQTFQHQNFTVPILQRCLVHHRFQEPGPQTAFLRPEAELIQWFLPGFLKLKKDVKKLKRGLIPHLVARTQEPSHPLDCVRGNLHRRTLVLVFTKMPEE